MDIRAIDDSQRKAARIVGLAYLLALPLALLGEFGATAAHLGTQERLFRLGTASNLAAFALDVVLITALYGVLKPVERHLALLATFWGLVETAILLVATVSDLTALRILGGAGPGLAPGADRLQELATLALGAHGAAYRVGLVLAGLRSATFAWLWLKSRYIPRPLAAWGVFSSLLMGGCAYALILFPELAKIVTVGLYGGPIFLFELAMGLWLLLKGLPRAVPGP